MLNTKKLFTKLIPKIKTMTGTTDANGNLSLGLSESAAKSIIGVTGSNYVYIPFVYAGNWYAKTVSSNSQATPVVNESVSVSIKYLRGVVGVTFIMSTFAHCLGRRWPYAEHKENAYENIALNTAKQENTADSDVLLWEVDTNIKLHAANRGEHYICIAGDKTECRLDNGGHKRLWEYSLRYILQQHIQRFAFRNCRTGYPVHAVTISGRGWACA